VTDLGSINTLCCGAGAAPVNELVTNIDEFLEAVVRSSERDRVRFVDFAPVVARAAAAGGEAEEWAGYMERKYSATLC
jgi:hypothetical protein